MDTVNSKHRHTVAFLQFKLKSVKVERFVEPKKKFSV